MEEILCNHDNYGGLYLDMTFNEKKLGYWEWEMEIIYIFFGFYKQRTSRMTLTE